MAFVRRSFCALLLIFGNFVTGRGAEPTEPLPHWIGPGRSQASKWIAERRFELAAGIRSAKLKFAADFCDAAVILNGTTLIRVEPYCQTQLLDVTKAVDDALRSPKVDRCPPEKPPANLLLITVSDGFGPLAVALTLTIVDGAGKEHVIQTDKAWAGRAYPGEPPPPDFGDLGKVRAELWGVGRRDATLSPRENYEQWRQASADRGPTQNLIVHEGFEVSLLHTAAADEGSWIALAFDPQGRVLISREDQGFLRLSFDDERRKVRNVERIASDLKECRGLLYAYDRWYANANNSKGMYRFRIDEAGRIAEQKLLREFPGGVGHGRNDLALGKDGRIYSIHGDSVERPGAPIMDRTSPLNPRPPRDKPNQAYVVSTDADGRSWELYCTGLRNPYGLGVHPDGDLFTYDADNEFDMGTPWYRPTRVVQLRSGADYGYRISDDNRRPNYVDRCDSALPLIDVGRGSPTACMFGTDLKFPQPYRDALYVLDWTYGRVLAVHIAPRGAGYRANLETFLQGRPLNVTDVAAGPDGAMYLITGGRKTQSALYRVAHLGGGQPSPAESRHERDVAEYSRDQRAVLTKLEALHGRELPNGGGTPHRRGYASAEQAARTLDLALEHCDHPDPAVRYAARTLLEQAPPEMRLLSILVPTRHPRKHVEFGVLSVRLLNALDLFDSVSRLEPLPSWPGRSLTEDFQYLDLHRIARRHGPATLHETRADFGRTWQRIAAKLSFGPRVSPHGDLNLFRRREAAVALGEGTLHEPEDVAKVAETLLRGNLQEDRLAGLEILSHVHEGWTPETRRLYFTALRDARRFVGGQGMPGFIDQIKSDAVATLSDSEKKQLADLLAPPKEVDEPLPPTRPVVKKWTLDELAKLTAAGGSDDPQLRGDATKGAVVFRDALCSRCHRAGLSGPAVGPDLTFVAARFSRRDILHSVLDPSAAVAEQYRNAEIITDDGRTLVGRVVAEGDYRSEKLLINVDPLRPSKVVEIDKKEIAEHRLLGTSPMPAGLLDGFTAAEVRDLLAFLEKPQTMVRQ